jgi:plastocyanin
VRPFTKKKAAGGFFDAGSEIELKSSMTKPSYITFRLALLTALLGISMACGSSSPSTPTPTPTPSPSGPGAASIVAGASLLTTTAYAPNPITVAVGGTVTWTNNDSTTHTSVSNSNAWNSGPIAPGGTFKMTFASAGSFPYHCSIHPGMVGTVTVQ